MSKLCFIDTETTALDADLGEVWEVGLIDRTPDGDVEHHWMLPVELCYADPFSLDIGGFHQRHPQGNDFGGGGPQCTDLDRFAAALAYHTHGAHIIGAVPSFDEERLRKIVRANYRVNGWHYHLVDVENLAAGYLAAQAERNLDTATLDVATPPWDSEDLSRALEIDPSTYERHTALGDARWARGLYDRVLAPNHR